jgi:hypothetical protein
MKKCRHILFALFGVVLGGVLCAYVFMRGALTLDDWKSLATSVSLLACLVVLLLSHALMISGARKWALLSHAIHGEKWEEPESGFFLRHYLWQNWIGQFVPPSLAIILGRGWAARHMPQMRMLSGLWSGLLDQALEFAVLVSFAGGSFAVLMLQGGPIFFIAGALAGVALLAGGFALGQRLLPEAWRAVFWPVFGWSIVRAALTVLRLVVGVYALGVFLSALKVAALAPVISILALIPLTPGNLGIAELGWQTGLTLAGEGLVAASLYAAAFRVLILIAQTLLLVWNEAYVFIVRKTY